MQKPSWQLQKPQAGFFVWRQEQPLTLGLPNDTADTVPFQEEHEASPKLHHVCNEQEELQALGLPEDIAEMLANEAIEYPLLAERIAAVQTLYRFDFLETYRISSRPNNQVHD